MYIQGNSMNSHIRTRNVIRRTQNSSQYLCLVILISYKTNLEQRCGLLAAKENEATVEPRLAASWTTSTQQWYSIYEEEQHTTICWEPDPTQPRGVLKGFTALTDDNTHRSAGSGALGRCRSLVWYDRLHHQQWRRPTWDKRTCRWIILQRYGWEVEEASAR